MTNNYSTPCSVADCCNFVGQHGALGLCSKHYKRQSATGTTSLIRRPTAIERLMDRVQINPTSGCWIWIAARQGRGWDQGGGYSAFFFDGRLTSGHRASYILHKGPIPPGLTIDHLCRNTLCVNPDHLEAVTLLENVVRASSLITHCPRGHEYDEPNTYMTPKGHRMCRKCRAVAVAECNKRKKLREADVNAS